MELVIILLIVLFIVLYRQSNGESVYKFVVDNVGSMYDKYAPFSFKVIREKCKEMGLEYTKRQYTIQVTKTDDLSSFVSSNTYAFILGAGSL